MLIRPRMYGSTESHCARTSTSPGPACGTLGLDEREVGLLRKALRPRRERDLPVHDASLTFRRLFRRA